MSLSTVNGIVVRYANYRDNDRILDILTGEMGLVTAAARGCRRQKSPLLAAGELFVFGEFVLYGAKDRYSVNACDVRETFYPLREDVERFAAGAYMLSLVQAGATAGEKSEAQLSLLYHALSFTAYAEVNPADMAICFAMRYLSLLGFRPALTSCAVCGRDVRGEKSLRFSAPAGGAVCGACDARGPSVSALSLEAVRRMLLLEDGDIKKVCLPERVRAELRPAVNEYAEHVLERRFKAMDAL
ncbi:MAG: DNA repair protein RecO [Clostridiaceae bacterium]|nr:DNA repair protein RecO [Eubacteriales bacterium]